MISGSTKGHQKNSQNGFYFVIDERGSLLMILNLIQMQ
jgi:hypothetical protein